MGYNTAFTGELNIEPPLNADEISYLNAFADSRRYQRLDHGPLAVIPPDMWPYSSTYNQPAVGQPSMYCNFTANHDGTQLVCCEYESTYEDDKWIAFLVRRLLSPDARAYIDEHITDDSRLASFTANHVINGEFTAFGDDDDDIWRIVVKDNIVERWDIEFLPVNGVEVILD